MDNDVGHDTPNLPVVSDDDTSRARITPKYQKVVAISGRIGYICKAIIYSIIGILAIISIVNHEVNDTSPQGVFIFLGSTPNGIGIILMIFVLIGIVLYAIWRWVEAFSGQGSTNQLSTWQNFFRYRLSPFVSGLVYMLYGAVIIDILVSNQGQTVDRGSDVNNSCFPACWMKSGWGIVGLVLISLALVIAFITQLVQTIFGMFISELWPSITKTRKPGIYYTMQVLGRIGFFGRALLFGLVGVAFALVVFGVQFVQDNRLYTIGQALHFWASYTWGSVLLFVMGICLIVYGVFALLCVVFRKFPTYVNVDRS